MLTRMVFLTTLAILVLPLSAQTTLPATSAAPTVAEAAGDTASGAVTGTVIGTDVNVRSDPSLTGAYVCTKVHKPAKVTVVEISGEWLKVMPTAGCYSVVGKKFVDAATGGKEGKINTDHVWVRAGGDLCTWTTVTQFWAVKHQLSTGDKVEILGSVGDFYKITPPQGSFYWINSRFVDLGGKTPAKASPADTGATVRVEPGSDTAGQETAEIVAKPPTATAPAVPDTAARTQFMQVEKDLQAEYRKPVDQRDLKGLIAKYEGIDIGDDAYLKRAIDSRVKFLNGQLRTIAEAKDVQDIARQTKDEATRIRAELAKVTVKANTPGPTVYAADGVLTPSGLFPGNEVSPKRYVVRDPDTNRITAYVQCTSGDVKLDDFVNKHVGVTGSTQYDRDLKLYIVEAKEVTVLKADAKLAVPPEPTVKPLPREEPPVEATPVKTDVQPAPVPAKVAPKPQTPESAEEEEPATKPATKDHETPDMGESAGPSAPDALPKGVPATGPVATPPAKETPPAKAAAPATMPTTRPAGESKPLPPTGLKVGDDDK